MSFIPLAALIVISCLYRHDLGFKALLTYFLIWVAALTTALLLKLAPGYFVAFQSLLAIAMLIQVRANPSI